MSKICHLKKTLKNIFNLENFTGLINQDFYATILTNNICSLIAPLEIIDEAVKLIVSGRIVEYRYDYKKESIKHV